MYLKIYGIQLLAEKLAFSENNQKPKGIYRQQLLNMVNMYCYSVKVVLFSLIVYYPMTNTLILIDT